MAGAVAGPWHDPVVDVRTSVLVLFVAVFALLWLRARSAVGRANARRGVRARRAEHEAEDLLAREGYEVLDRQVTREWPVDVDGERHLARVRADLLVSRDGYDYIAEVKTGADATRPTFPSTRRQMLEYLLAFDVDGVLLVDMDRRVVRSVEFPRLDIEG